MSSIAGGQGPLMALLGPTNTGKTHQAVERMLEWDTGMIGLPLRLLAREVYDRVTTRVGEGAVALVTGEEKRIPRRPRFWVCTVESMPTDRDVDFLAVDEVQLAANAQRGHVFTDRLLHARGIHETWFMGAQTMRPLVQQLLPTAHIHSSPRLSMLRAAGSCSLATMPPRTALVAFSFAQVYELAERVRRRKGGVAVVLGALSPRTRNAQVAMYQSGEVDYLVATDAIGMGLNMHVDHVAFASIKKYDGKETRVLEPAELAQIAGRAGRHMNDGSFGTVAPLPPLPDSVSFAVESHRFPDVRHWVWRSRDLDFCNLDSLIESLRQRPPRPQLRLVREAEDFEALCHLAGQDEVRRRVTTPEAVALLWEVCQIPDFGGHLVAHHTKLLRDIFEQLSGPRGALDSDWIEQSVQRVDDPQGDIDTLMLRIELIRTWNYISHHPRWVLRARDWQERTELIEEQLSEALHARLVERFVQGSSSATRRSGGRRGRNRRRANPNARSSSPFAQLLQMELCADPDGSAAEGRAEDWIQALLEAPHEQIHSDAAGKLYFDQHVVGRLTHGADLLHPEVRVATDLDLPAGRRSELQRRLLAWSRDLVDQTLAPLRRTPARALSPAGRGLVYQLEQSLGTVTAESARDQLRCLSDQDRAHLRRLDVAMGRRLVYVRSLLKPAMVQRRLALCAAHWRITAAMPILAESTVSLPVTTELGGPAHLLIGYPTFGPRAIRADLAERIHRHLQRASARGRFPLPVEVASWLGCSQEELVAVIEGYGYVASDDGTFFRHDRRQRRGRRPPKPR